MKISFSPPDIGEQEIIEVSEALRSGWITTGPRTKKLENLLAGFVNTKKVVCTNSATSAMEMVLRILNVGPGDEVIVPAYTYTSSASVVCHVGAKVIMVDCAPNTLEMDYNKVEAVINEHTKVIIPVDLAGIMCNYERIYEIVEKKKKLFHASNDIQKSFNRIIISSDAAHALGSVRKGKMCGEVADFTSFSFHAVKNFTTGEGGAITWKSNPNIDDEWLYTQLQLLSLHGQNKDALAKTKLGSWEYDIISPAYKNNMTDIMAAIGLVQFKRYSGMLKRRQEIIARYDKAFESLNVQVLPHKTKISQSSGHLYIIRLLGRSIEFRNQAIIEMAKREIACNVHYKPLPMMTAYKNLGMDIMNFPNAYDMYHNEVTIPLHTCLTDEQVDFIIKNFIEVVHILDEKNI